MKGKVKVRVKVKGRVKGWVEVTGPESARARQA
jgi:hypothetical protein